MTAKVYESRNTLRSTRIGDARAHALRGTIAGALAALPFFLVPCALGATDGQRARESTVDCVLNGVQPVMVAQAWPKDYFIAYPAPKVARDAVGVEGLEGLRELIDPDVPGPELGTLYRAVHETPEAALLGHYSAADGCFSTLLGWVARKDLLESPEAMKVGELVSASPGLAARLRARYPGAAKAINEHSTVQMRVLMRPERLTRPKYWPHPKAPENMESAIGDAYFWRYVYKLHHAEDDTVWYLLATHPELDEESVIDTRMRAESGAGDTRSGVGVRRRGGAVADEHRARTQCA